MKHLPKILLLLCIMGGQKIYAAEQPGRETPEARKQRRKEKVQTLEATIAEQRKLLREKEEMLQQKAKTIGIQAGGLRQIEEVVFLADAIIKEQRAALAAQREQIDNQAIAIAIGQQAIQKAAQERQQNQLEIQRLTQQVAEMKEGTNRALP